MDTPDWSPIWRRAPELGQPLLPAQARLYLAQLDDLPLDDIDPTYWSGEERHRAEAMTHGQQRHRFLASRYLLREQLAMQTGDLPKSLSFTVLPHGKPILTGTQQVPFNLAHTGAFWLLGMTAETAIGVDLERIRPLSNMMRLAERVFSPTERQELADIKDSLQQQVAFFRGWTRKEAALKAISTGFSQPAAALHIGLAETSHALPVVWQKRELFVYSGVTSDTLFWAVAVHHPLSSIRGFRLILDALATDRSPALAR